MTTQSNAPDCTEFSTFDRCMMSAALDQAQQAEKCGEVPVGAVIADPTTQEIVSVGHNLLISNSDPTAHAEIIAIRQACKLRETYRLVGLDLYVSLEPCIMCSGAIVQARLRRVLWAADDPKAGGVVSMVKCFELDGINHHPDCASGLMAAESAHLLKAFFRAKRSGA